MNVVSSALVIAMMLFSCGKDSDLGTAEVVITPTVASSSTLESAFTPTFQVAVTPSEDEMEIEGARVYYTADGTDPSASSDFVEVLFTDPKDDTGKFNATSESMPAVGSTVTFKYLAKIDFVQKVNKKKKKRFDQDSEIGTVVYGFGSGGDTDGPEPEVPTSTLPTASVALAPTSGTPTALFCNRFTATSNDVNGATTKADQNVTFTLAATGGGAFYSNSACSGTITQATITQGSTSTSVFYKIDNPGVISLVATYAGTAGTAYATTLGGPVVSSISLTKGTTSACITVVVTMRDAMNNAMIQSMTAPTTVTLTQDRTVLGTAAERSFYSDSGCTNSLTTGSVTTATIPAGTTFVTIYLAPASSAGTYAYDMSWSSGSSSNSGYRDSFLVM